jgi:two-component system, cell cycle sensor histidine kinase and response regulator CckA
VVYGKDVDEVSLKYSADTNTTSTQEVVSKDDYIEAEKVRKIYAQLPLGVAATLVNAFVLSFALLPVVSHFHLGIWMGGIIALSCLRLGQYIWYIKAGSISNRVKTWKQLFYANMLVSGMVWGAVAIFLFPHEYSVHQVFMAFILGGMIAGSMGIYSIIQGTFWAFSVPILMPIVIRFFATGSEVSFSMGAMLAIFWCIMLFSSKRLNSTLTTSIALRFENTELIADLRSEINEREKAERALRHHQREIELTVDERTSALQTTNEKLSREIEWRKKTDEALRESEEKYREFVENINDVIYSFDNTGMVLYVSPPVEAIFGYRPDEIIGKPFNALIHPEEQTRVKERFQKIMAGDIKAQEYRVEHKKGGYRWVQVSSRPLIKNGEVIGIQGVLRDLDEKKRLEAKLQQAMKMEAIGAVAGSVAHDLNNILSGILSYPQLMLMEMANDDPLRESLEIVQKSGEKAAAIVQDLLTLTRRGVMSISAVSLNGIIHDYLASPEHENLLTHHSGVRVSFRPDANLLNILGSYIHILKTVMNLVNNAAEAIHGEGEVLITTENRYMDQSETEAMGIQEGDYAMLSISDTGEGIDPQFLDRIFEPFFTNKKIGRSGTGLGMAVVWGTVQDHKGHIDVSSQLGHGTAFTLYFPATQQDVFADSSGNFEQYMGNGESILVVDDVEEQRGIASAILTKLGYRVTTVASGEEAIDLLKKQPTDLLLLDMIMAPGMDGLETYRRIISDNPQQKAIIVSGYSETDRIKEVQMLGAIAYLKKPYLLESLGCIVREEFDRV